MLASEPLRKRANSSDVSALKPCFSIAPAQGRQRHKQACAALGQEQPAQLTLTLTLMFTICDFSTNNKKANAES